MSKPKKTLNLRKELENYYHTSSIKSERCYIDSKWWYIQTLINYVKDNKSPEYDLQLDSVDLGVMPWSMKTILHFIQHSIDIENVTFRYPVIVSPSGWVLNGWHRIIKAILTNKTSIKAVRILDMPQHDGIDTKEN